VSKFVPELGQYYCGNPTGEFALSELGLAVFFHALRELRRVYQNLHDVEWEDYTNGTIGPVTWNRYYWGDAAYATSEPDEFDRPNFVAFEVELRWYKHPGRGMSVNVEYSPQQWADWLERVLAGLEAVERAGLANGRTDEDDPGVSESGGGEPGAGP
jgi:hypothetical protein